MQREVLYEQVKLMRSIVQHLTDATSNIITETFNNIIQAFKEISEIDSRPLRNTHVERGPMPLPILNDDTEENKTNSSDENAICSICMENDKRVCFSCGHLTCETCCQTLVVCPFCKQKITIKIKLFMC